MKTWVLAAATITAMTAFGGLAEAAGARVDIVLRDASTNSAIHGMHMVAHPSRLPAGEVTLHAKNESKDLVHEVVVVKVRNFRQQLPYNAKAQEVVEGKVDRLGEIDDLKPGTSGTITLRMRPGDYVLLCNQPGHYKQGMWTKLTVAR